MHTHAGEPTQMCTYLLPTSNTWKGQDLFAFTVNSQAPPALVRRVGGEDYKKAVVKKTLLNMSI